MRTLGSLYTLLDIVEMIVLESQPDEDARNKYLRQMYLPRGAKKAKRPPPGWGADDEMSEFRAAQQS